MSGKFAPGLDPRCQRPPKQGRAPETLNATMLLKPCCYYSTSRSWDTFTEWAIKNGCDPFVDLDASTKTIDEVKESPTWNLLQQGLIDGNVCGICYEKCSDDQEERGTKEANNWKKIKS